MARKNILDSMTEAQLEAAQVKRNQQKLEEIEQQKKEKLIAQCHELIGRVQASSMIAKFADVSRLLWLKQVKETKIYKDIPGIGSWQSFCNYIGSSRGKADEDLLNLKTLGEEFLLTVGSFKVGYKDLRKLRQSANSGEINITSESLEIDGEKIPFDADHKGDLEAAIERVIEQKEEEVRQREKKAKKKGKLSEEIIRGLKSERDALIRDNQRLKVFEEKPRADEDLGWCEEQMVEIYNACISFTVLCEKFVVDERLEGDRNRQGKVAGLIESTQLALRDLHRTWVDQFIPDDGLHG